MFKTFEQSGGKMGSWSTNSGITNHCIKITLGLTDYYQRLPINDIVKWSFVYILKLKQTLKFLSLFKLKQWQRFQEVVDIFAFIIIKIPVETGGKDCSSTCLDRKTINHTLRKNDRQFNKLKKKMRNGLHHPFP